MGKFSRGSESPTKNVKAKEEKEDNWLNIFRQYVILKKKI